MIGRSRHGINMLKAPVQRRRAMLVGISMQRTAQRRIGWGNWHKPIEQCLQIETAPCYNQDPLPTLPYSLKYLPRARHKLGGVTGLMRQEQIQYMMRHLGLLGHGRLRSTDIHVSVELARINVDNLSVKGLRNRQRQSRFAHRSGTD